MKKEYEMELVINGCKEQFAEGFSLGGFAKQNVGFKVTKKDMHKLDASILQAVEKFIRENIEVRIREVGSEEVTCL